MASRSRVQNLDPSSFKLREVKGKQYFFLERPGLSIVMYHKEDCKFCPGALELYTALAPVYPNLNFYVFNVGKYLPFIKQTHKTSLKIAKTPFVVLYKEGKPYSKLEANVTKENLIEFFNSTRDMVVETKKFSSAPPSSVGRGSTGSREPYREGKMIPERTSSAAMVPRSAPGGKVGRTDDVETGEGIPFNMVCDDEGCYLTDSELESGKCEGGVCEFAFSEDL